MQIIEKFHIYKLAQAEEAERQNKPNENIQMIKKKKDKGILK
jgi:hypothetical protein